ncbi:hypothetical protein GCM10023093_20810 [Nemorincola caseinilytica]|uniref:Uncharacterized protein n=1 Tax=Nemorincola caseinilytica TaxID=2054315 RepID=A0ABP8NIT0_9BACT
MAGYRLRHMRVQQRLYLYDQRKQEQYKYGERTIISEEAEQMPNFMAKVSGRVGMSNYGNACVESRFVTKSDGYV